MTTTRECIECGTAFQPAHFNTKVCSDECALTRRRRSGRKYAQKNAEIIRAKHAENMKCPEYREKRRLESEKLRRKYAKRYTCIICGNDFKLLNRSKTCSDECLELRNKERKKNYQGREDVKARRNALRHKRMECPIYRAKVQERNNQWRRERMKDPEYASKIRQMERERFFTPFGKLNNRVRASINAHLKRRGKSKRHKTFDILGYTPIQLMKHLESQFVEGMSWDNMSEWHIDHIRPVASFTFDSVDDPEFKACWALENLQPLWATDNLSKGAKWEGLTDAKA